jgi:hypothetical protein
MLVVFCCYCCCCYCFCFCFCCYSYCYCCCYCLLVSVIVLVSVLVLYIVVCVGVMVKRVKVENVMDECWECCRRAWGVVERVGGEEYGVGEAAGEGSYVDAVARVRVIGGIVVRCLLGVFGCLGGDNCGCVVGVCLGTPGALGEGVSPSSISISTSRTEVVGGRVVEGRVAEGRGGFG